MLAGAIALTSAAIVAYVGNRIITFEVLLVPVGRNPGLFAATAVAPGRRCRHHLVFEAQGLVS